VLKPLRIRWIEGTMRDPAMPVPGETADAA